ncbi:uncharacterized protein LTR77_004693 [Saxophila tyrrhenica]|uniref:Methyltransferase domain-containing protein n=1 Tax=Saxophila tyrrhenica TaxID=1690608 RepID=A0AAV9PA53_9PEZI|nr:hypothetical protein LTR77_004693 [Saxophila tyrrhenica]
MTQPSSADMTFDSSLVDVQRSFSSTDTNTTSSTGKENMPPSDHSDPVSAPTSQFKDVSTDELYSEWAATYDTDGNILQFIDDLQMTDLLEQFVSLCCAQDLDSNDYRLDILDLGCGTGRNTLKLLQTPWPTDRDVNVHGWDGSQAMLDLARTKCANAVSSSASTKMVMEFAAVDISNPENVPKQYDDLFNGLISTLVLEHIEIETFFAIVARLLKPGAHALITNMHSDMGRLSRAGYKAATGERYRATSYIYTPQETVEAAAAAGLDLVGEIDEVAVDGRMIDGGVLDNGVRVEKGGVREGARKWVGTKVWYGMMLRKR